MSQPRKYCRSNCPYTSENNMIFCEGPCENWYHFKCVGIRKEGHDQLIIEGQYFCPNCRNNHPTENPRAYTDLNLERPTERAGSAFKRIGAPARPTEPLQEIDTEETSNRTNPISDQEAIPKDHYEVDEIINHKGKNSLQYKIRWKGYGASEDSWLREEDLADCYEVLKNYKSKEGLGSPSIPRPRVGASSSERANFNQDNWVSMKEILEAVTSFSQKEYPKKIGIKEFQGLGEEDSIYLIQIGNHCLVGLFFHKSNDLYLADGGNLFIRFPRIQKLTLERLGVKPNIHQIQFNLQRGIDFCGSSAACIALEFRRLYGRGERIPNNLSIEKSTQERISKRLHKAPTESINSWKKIQDNMPTHTCEKCQKVFKERNRQRFSAHIRMCSGSSHQDPGRD